MEIDSKAIERSGEGVKVTLEENEKSNGETTYVVSKWLGGQGPVTESAEGPPSEQAEHSHFDNLEDAREYFNNLE
jgi:hypothetical protein